MAKEAGAAAGFSREAEHAAAMPEAAAVLHPLVDRQQVRPKDVCERPELVRSVRRVQRVPERKRIRDEQIAVAQDIGQKPAAPDPARRVRGPGAQALMLASDLSRGTSRHPAAPVTTPINASAASSELLSEVSTIARARP